MSFTPFLFVKATDALCVISALPKRPLRPNGVASGYADVTAAASVAGADRPPIIVRPKDIGACDI